MHAARVRHGWFSPPQSSTDVARVVLSSLLFFSRSVAPRAALPRSTHTRRGRAHHDRARGACDARRDARGAWESERRAPSEFAVRVRGNGRPRLPWGFTLLRTRSCSVRSAPRDRRRAGRAHHERAHDARGARCGARGVRGRQGKSAFLCRGSRFARVLCLSLLSSLHAALLPRSPPRRRARASGHTTHPRSERRVCAALHVCLWFVCASFRGLARRAARSCALLLRKTEKSCFFPLVRRLAGLGGPWRSKNHTQTTTGFPYVHVWCVKCVFSNSERLYPCASSACLCGSVFYVSIRWVIGRSRLSRFRSSGGLSSGWRQWAGRQNSVASCDVGLCSTGWRFASRWCD